MGSSKPAAGTEKVPEQGFDKVWIEMVRPIKGMIRNWFSTINLKKFQLVMAADREGTVGIKFRMVFFPV